MVHLVGRLGDEVLGKMISDLESEIISRGYIRSGYVLKKEFPGGTVWVDPRLISFLRRDDGSLYTSMSYTMGNYRLKPVFRILDHSLAEQDQNSRRMVGELNQIRAYIEAYQLQPFQEVRSLKYMYEDSEGFPRNGELIYYAEEEAQLYAGNMLCNNFLSEEDRLALEARCS